MKRPVIAVLVAVLCLAGAACGSRVDSQLRTQAADAALATGGGARAQGPVAGSASDGVVDPGAVSAGTIPGTVGDPGLPATGGPQATIASGQPASGAVGAPAPAGGNGGATDVGVTATSITVGNVADLSGPVPGLFQAAPYGAEAYFAYVNSQGGVFGRQLKLAGGDSQTDCTANQNAHTRLIPKVFAFVGSFSVYDDCGTKILKEHPDVPDLSYALGPATKANTVSNFPPQVAPLGYQNGMFCHWAQKYGDAVKHVGSIYGNIPAAATSQKMIEHAAESCGWRFVDSIPVAPTATTFDAEINKMKNDGVKIIFEIGTTGQNAAEIKREADAQNWHPLFIMPIAYASDFIERLGSAEQAEGIVGHNLYSMFFNTSEAANIPEVALFQQWMKRTHPSAALELYAMYSWAAAKLFVQVLRTVGPNVTRKAFVAAIRNVHRYDGGGIVNESDIGGHKPTNCYLLWEIRSGAYHRVDTPANTYRCDGTFIPYSGG